MNGRDHRGADPADSGAPSAAAAAAAATATAAAAALAAAAPDPAGNAGACTTDALCIYNMHVCMYIRMYLRIFLYLYILIQQATHVRILYVCIQHRRVYHIYTVIHI